MRREGEEKIKELRRDYTPRLTETEHGCCTESLKQINGLVVEPGGEQSERDRNVAIDCLIDAMYLQLIHLIEQQIRVQRQLQSNTSRSQLILARNRLQQGLLSRTITSRLPGCPTPYRALCRLVECGRSWCSTLQLFRFKVDPSHGFFDPFIRLFGALVPYSLRMKHHLWEQRIELIVECANIQRELQSLIKSIEQVKWARRNRIRNKWAAGILWLGQVLSSKFRIKSEWLLYLRLS